MDDIVRMLGEEMARYRKEYRETKPANAERGRGPVLM